jgi:hypothetical protein
MKCECCKESADTIVETENSSFFLCENCGESLFLAYLLPKYESQGLVSYECQA